MRRILILGFAVVVACGGKDDDGKRAAEPAPARKVAAEDAGAPEPSLPPAPAGPIAGDRALVQFVLYAKADVAKEVEAARKKSYRYLTVADDVGPDMALPAIVVEPASLADYPPPAPDLLPYVAQGLSPEQLEWIKAPKTVTVVGVFFAQADALRVNKDAIALVEAVAAKTGALVWDAQAGELQTAATVRQRLARWTKPVPPVWNHMSVHAVRDGDLTHIDTVGMERFALPNLVVEAVPPAFVEEMFLLVNVAAQTMLERGRLDRAGELPIDVYALQDADPRPADAPADAGKVALRVEVVEDSAREGRAWKIAFPGPRASLHERQRAALDALFGSERTIQDTEHDEELLAVSKQAIAELEKLEPAFRKGLPPGETLYVKAPFETASGGNEWMWLEVHAWKDGVVRGVLLNDPRDVPDLAAGAKVEARVDSLFDYVHKKADGTQVGDATGQLLMKRAESSK